jgi:hypothetical protein
LLFLGATLAWPLRLGVIVSLLLGTEIKRSDKMEVFMVR